MEVAPPQSTEVISLWIYYGDYMNTHTSIYIYISDVGG